MHARERGAFLFLLWAGSFKYRIGQDKERSATVNLLLNKHLRGIFRSCPATAPHAQRFDRVSCVLWIFTVVPSMFWGGILGIYISGGPIPDNLVHSGWTPFCIIMSLFCLGIGHLVAIDRYRQLKTMIELFNRGSS